jgi:hypothetical protein
MKIIVKVIETNLSLNENNNEIMDYQSRVIEVDTWSSFIDEIKNGKTVDRQSIVGHLWGVSVSRKSIVKNVKYDDFHLSCDIYNYAGQKSKKLAYLAD